jgi:hypothetical protein
MKLYSHSEQPAPQGRPRRRTLVKIAISIVALYLASHHTLPVRDAGMSAHNIIEFLLTVAAFAVAGLCVGRAVAAYRGSVDVQMVGLLLGFYAIVVSSATRVVAAENIYLVLIGAFAALVGGLLGASIAQTLSRAAR